MVTILLIFLVVVDLVMLGAVLFLGKHRSNPTEILREIAQEKQELKEIGQAFKEDLRLKEEKLEEIFKKINVIAAEAEIEAKSYKETMNKEMTTVLEQFSHELESTAENAANHRASLSGILQKSERERKALQRIVHKSEKLSKFFNKKVCYEQVLEEIEDKKYVDARHLLAQGMSEDEVALEVGLPKSEISLIAAIG